MKAFLTTFIKQLNEIHHQRPWIGSSYSTKLKSITEEEAFTRPLKHMNSIAELLSHLTFWREEAILKIKTGTGSKTDADPGNFLPLEVLKTKGWAKVKQEHDDSLAELISLLQQKEDTFLDEEYYDTDYKGTYPYRFLIEGMLQHDVYHLGQIGIVVKYLKIVGVKG